MPPKHPRDRLPALNASGKHDLMGSFTARPAEEMPDDIGMARRAACHELFIPSLPPAG
jgi:hypothetical protein